MNANRGAVERTRERNGWRYTRIGQDGEDSRIIRAVLTVARAELECVNTGIGEGDGSYCRIRAAKQHRRRSRQIIPRDGKGIARQAVIKDGPKERNSIRRQIGYP